MTPVTPEFLDDVCYLYVECGWTAEEIGRRMQRSTATIFYHLKNAGVKMRPCGTGSYKTLK